MLTDRQCFSHGQLYVALSRVTSMEGIKIFSPNTCRGPGLNFIENVVYYELLDDHFSAAFRTEEIFQDDMEVNEDLAAGALDDQFEYETDSDMENQPC